MEHIDKSPAHALASAASATGLARLLLRAIWLLVVPLVLAACAQHYLLPTPFEAHDALAALLLRLGTEQPVAVFVVLFLAFAALFRYWQFYLPGVRRITASSWGIPTTVTPARLRQYEPYLELLAQLKAAKHASPSPSLAENERNLRAALAEDSPARAETSAKAVADALGKSQLDWRELSRSALVLAVVVLVTLALRSSVTQPYRVLTGSMLPTLEPGDWIAANKLAYSFRVPFSHTFVGARPPARGDVIAFETPPDAARGQPEELVKRVIGLPGDRITMRHGQPSINGWTVPSCDAGVYAYLSSDNAVSGRLMVEFLQGQAYLTVYFAGSQPFPGYVVKPGEVFVLGDNRDNSSDSRAWNNDRGAGLPFAAIDGRVSAILVGSKRDGSADWAQILKPLRRTLRFQGLDVSALQANIEHCLATAPSDTTPPP